MPNIPDAELWACDLQRHFPDTPLRDHIDMLGPDAVRGLEDISGPGVANDLLVVYAALAAVIDRTDDPEGVQRYLASILSGELPRPAEALATKLFEYPIESPDSPVTRRLILDQTIEGRIASGQLARRFRFPKHDYAFHGGSKGAKKGVDELIADQPPFSFWLFKGARGGEAFKSWLKDRDGALKARYGAGSERPINAFSKFYSHFTFEEFNDAPDGDIFLPPEEDSERVVCVVIDTERFARRLSLFDNFGVGAKLGFLSISDFQRHEAWVGVSEEERQAILTL